MKRIFGSIILLILICRSAFAQFDSTRLVKYSHDFKFTEGLFLNFEQVKDNRPIAKSRILTPVDIYNKEFFRKVLAKDIIYYYDRFGVRQEIKTDNIWGYSRNSVLYYQTSGDFHRITIVGGICHFVANITTYENRYYDPYYYRYSYYDYYYHPSRHTPYTKSEIRQFILEFDSGKVMEYDIKSVAFALMRDPELHDQYMRLSKRKKKQLKFLYIRQFNERNPIYFPVN